MLSLPGPTWAVVFAVPALAVSLMMSALTILHHAGHGRFSRSIWWNALAVHSASPVGFWTFQWARKHRIHHQFPAVYPVDPFTAIEPALRLHAGARRRPPHRFQHVYVWPIYALAWTGEMASQLRFLSDGHIAGVRQADRLWHVRWSFAAEKAMAASCLAPYFVLCDHDLRLAGSIAVAVAAGSALAGSVVGVGHINLGLAQKTTVQDWTQHVIATTASFAVGSRFVPWLTGGLTHHAAHHLRPLATRSELRAVHERLVSDQAAAGRDELIVFKTFRDALRGHFRALRVLGAPVLADVPEIQSDVLRGAARPRSLYVVAASTAVGASLESAVPPARPSASRVPGVRTTSP